MQLWSTGDYATTLEAFVAYAREQPERALDIAMGLEGDEAWRLVMELVQALPVSAGGVAMDVLLRHEKYHKACPPLHAVFVLCAKADFERAWREATKPGVKYTESALDAVAYACSESKKAARGMELAVSIAEPVMKRRFTERLLREWSANDARGLLKWLEGQPGREDVVSQVRWAKMRFDTREEFLAMLKVVPLELLDGSRAGDRRFDVAEKDGWPTRFDWLRSIPDEATRAAAMTGATRALLHFDPELALQLAGEITDQALQRHVYSAVAAYRASTSPEEGFAFADALPDELARQRARASVLLTWGENDPVGAFRHAAGSSGGDMVDTLRQIGQRWMEIDPQAAAAASLGLEGPVFDTLMQNWVSRDPFSASRWVKELPMDGSRDRAASQLARAAVYEQPEGALVWAAGIADEALRRQTLESCFATWRSEDRARAEAWFQQADLDEATRQQLGEVMNKAAATPRAAGSMRNGTDKIMVIY